jgi:hypothetical protein
MSDEDDLRYSELKAAMDRLASEVHELRLLLEKLRLQQYIQALLNPRRIAFYSLISGIFSGLGAILGATVVLAFLVYVLSKLQVVPYIGHFVYEIIRIVEQNRKP